MPCTKRVTCLHTKQLFVWPPTQDLQFSSNMAQIEFTFMTQIAILSLRVGSGGINQKERELSKWIARLSPLQAQRKSYKLDFAEFPLTHPPLFLTSQCEETAGILDSEFAIDRYSPDHKIFSLQIWRSGLQEHRLIGTAWRMLTEEIKRKGRPWSVTSANQVVPPEICNTCDRT